MEPAKISIRGARMHNLKNVNVDIPRNSLVVFTGLSGSGKSTLAFDTLYAEGQRRYVESLSTYARQFLGQMDKPDVDALEGLSPAVSIEQKTTSKNPRSTVGTVTEIYDHLRLLFARCGRPYCPECGDEIRSQSIEDMVGSLSQFPEGTKVVLLAPMVTGKKGRHEQLLTRIRKEGFVRIRVDGEIVHTDDVQALEKNKHHSIEVVVDRVVIKASSIRRLSDSITTAVKLTEGFLLVHFPDSGEDQLFSEFAACHRCGISMPRLSTQLFSFNNPQGACEECGGLGVKQFFDAGLIVPDPSLSIKNGAIAPWGKRAGKSYSGQMLEAVAKHYSFSMTTPFVKLPQKLQNILLYGSGSEAISFCYQKGHRKMTTVKPYEGVIPQLNRRFHETNSPMIREELGRFMNEQTCPQCHGERLKPEALSVKAGKWSIYDLTCLSIEQMIEYLPLIPFSSRERQIAEPILKEIVDRLSFLEDVGLGYLSLERKSGTLSGGEAQRIRLASQIGSRLAGVLYILDEPSIGLHQRDNQKLINTLIELRDMGNSVIVVEHDTDTIMTADFILDMGPGAGVHGGEVVYAGDVQGLLKCDTSLTGNYLCGSRNIAVPEKRRKAAKRQFLRLKHGVVNNLKNIDVSFPLGVMTCITGVSGSGKSSLVIETLFPLAKEGVGRRLDCARIGKTTLSGLDKIDKIVDIDQSPIGRTPRSNPATYTGVFTPVRELFARLPESRVRGYKLGQFSFNVKGGRCEACEGEGVNKIAMHFLPDIYVVCEACQGKRYNQETLEIKYRGKNIHEVLSMTVEEALEFFKNIPPVKNRLQTLYDVGLTYISLGQSSVTLSGGEAQRVKLAKELSGRASGKTLYILDEPTTGLHPADIEHLLCVLGRLVDNGNTVVVIEHNLDVIKTADWVIDVGPEGGDNGGNIVATGTPEKIVQSKGSFTGYYLGDVLKR
ncbi:excinuclease ABC, A subunit [Desulfocapsa sulfexigens DSM 10523]|uniref:UvrABC system protein A n=1 Tax=Desulfocapsa sulfexigens (strain DSM 10523 / SB164P1) TaxID=1167006 RepID=M1PCA9_DESSD|nr:excinuclease ABC subunit UvrA [Desulfocapsa sulfexigens]AGF77380.1 excinuclease ABC, A subunit [Desulfocapsa sulfexigens DSM 10523]